MSFSLEKFTMEHLVQFVSKLSTRSVVLLYCSNKDFQKFVQIHRKDDIQAYEKAVELSKNQSVYCACLRSPHLRERYKIIELMDDITLWVESTLNCPWKSVATKLRASRNLEYYWKIFTQILESWDILHTDTIYKYNLYS